MIAVKKYSDLLIEIKLCKLRIKDIETQIENINKLMMKHPVDIKGMNYDGMPKGSADYTTLDRYYIRRNNLVDVLDFEYELYEDLTKQKVEYKKMLQQLSGTEYKVAYLRIIKCMSHKQIAEKLGKSEQYVRNIYCKVSKL